MPTFVALLRGINVGKAKRVSMADLRALLAGSGYTGVTTLLNSGNVVFQAPRGKPATYSAAIAAAIAAKLKVDAAVIVRSASELTAIISDNPIRAQKDEHSRLLAVFAQ